MILYVLTCLLLDEVRPPPCRRRNWLSASSVRDESTATGAERVCNGLSI